MKTIILKWNPAFSSYTILRFLKDLQMAWERDDEDRKSNWSVWDYDKVSEGDLFYLLKVGYGQTGLVARGRVVSDAYLDEDWTPNDKPRYYVDYVPDFMINPDGMKLLSSQELTEGIPDFDFYGGHSGIVLSDEAAAKLEVMWQTYVASQHEYFNKASDENLFMQIDNQYTDCDYTVKFSRDYHDDPEIEIISTAPYFGKTLKHNIDIFDYWRTLKKFKVVSKRQLLNVLHSLYPSANDLGRLCMDLYSFGINFRNWVNLIDQQTDDEEE